MSSRKSKKPFRSVVASGRQYFNALHLLWSGQRAHRNSKTVFVLDPALRDNRGHHLDEAKCLLAEAGQMGLRCLVLGNQEADRKTLGLPVWSHFRVSGYGAAKRGKGDDDHSLEQNRMLFQDLSRLPASVFSKDDLVLFPAVTRNQIFGICQWIARFSGQAAVSPRFAVSLMFAPDWLKSPPTDDAEAIYRRAVACLGPSCRVVWTCETAGLAEAFEPLLGCRPIVLPLVILPDLTGLELTAVENRRFPSEPMVSILGYTKAEKGSLMVPEIIERVGQKRPGARFTVQALSRTAKHEDALAQACEGLRPAPKIVRGSVDQQSFIRLLDETDLMLLPYDAESYGQRGSGLANQAAVLGIPMVAPAGCSFADTAAQEDRAVLFTAHDPGSIATAVVAALDRLEDLKGNAAAVASLAAEKPGYLATLWNATSRGRYHAS